MTTFTRRFTDPKECEKAIEAAAELGFEPVDFRFLGSWEAEGNSFFGDSADELVKTGDKYFHLRMNVDSYKRKVWRCEPKTTESDLFEDGKLVVEFADTR